jgi:hypothetical protein
VTVLLLALDPFSFILDFFLGYLYHHWDIPVYLFDLIDTRLYPLAVFFGIVPTYELIAQVYVYLWVRSGQARTARVRPSPARLSLAQPNPAGSSATLVSC